MKHIGFLLITLLFAVCAYSQPPELVLEKNVPAHPAIDAIYRDFSKAYKTLDVEKVSGLYSDSAAYLPPDDGILQGREQIRQTFRAFFDYVRNEGRTMSISFQIFQRRVEKNLAYDVGVYTIRQYKEGKSIGEPGRGKFVVVAVRDKKGQWLFQVDGYSGLKPENQNKIN